MNHIKTIVLLLLGAGLVLTSCTKEEDENYFASLDPRGAVVSLSAPSPDFFDSSQPDAKVSFEVNTKGEEVSQVTVFKNLNGTGLIEHATISSFPATVEVSLNDALSGTGQSVGDMKVGDEFVLSFEIATISGVYRSGASVSLPVSCSTKLPGTYDFESTDYFCEGGALTGTVTISETTPGSYTFSDWAFGTYEECYGGGQSDWGTLAFVRYTDPSCDECTTTPLCNTVSITGVDAFGDSWTFSIENVDGPNLTMKWENTYGEFATTTLIRTDGSVWPPLQ